MQQVVAHSFSSFLQCFIIGAIIRNKTTLRSIVLKCGCCNKYILICLITWLFQPSSWCHAKIPSWFIFRFFSWRVEVEIKSWFFFHEWRNKSGSSKLSSHEPAVLLSSQRWTKACMKLRDVSLPLFSLRDSSSGRPRHPLKWTKGANLMRVRWSHKPHPLSRHAM